MRCGCSGQQRFVREEVRDVLASAHEMRPAVVDNHLAGARTRVVVRAHRHGRTRRPRRSRAGRPARARACRSCARKSPLSQTGPTMSQLLRVGRRAGAPRRPDATRRRARDAAGRSSPRRRSRSLRASPGFRYSTRVSSTPASPTRRRPGSNSSVSRRPAKRLAHHRRVLRERAPDVSSR